jgi:hypothetical protein
MLYSVYSTADSKVSAAEENLKKFEVQLKKANTDLEKLQKNLMIKMKNQNNINIAIFMSSKMLILFLIKTVSNN